MKPYTGLCAEPPGVLLENCQTSVVLGTPQQPHCFKSLPLGLVFIHSCSSRQLVSEFESLGVKWNFKLDDINYSAKFFLKLPHRPVSCFLKNLYHSQHTLTYVTYTHTYIMLPRLWFQKFQRNIKWHKGKEQNEAKGNVASINLSATIFYSSYLAN